MQETMLKNKCARFSKMTPSALGYELITHFSYAIFTHLKIS